jgi:predicted dehydrogenase
MSRRHHPLYRSFPQVLSRVGAINFVDASYTLNIERLDLGWRSVRARAGGGALLDMGYHIIDLFIWYFGLPTFLGASIASHARPDQMYDVEDAASLQMEYQSSSAGHFVARMHVSRTSPHKSESLMIQGTRGTVVLTRDALRWLDLSGANRETLNYSGSSQNAAIRQIDDFGADLLKGSVVSTEFAAHFQHLAMIDGAYHAAASHTIINPTSFLPSLKRSAA